MSTRAPVPRSLAGLRVALADDSVLFRAGLARLLAEAGMTVVGEVGDGPAIIELVRETRPDVVVLDIRMPPGHATEGLEAAIAIREAAPATAVLLLSAYVETRHALRLLRDGSAGIGYLLKDRILREAELLDAIGRVAAGGSAIDPELVGVLLGRPRAHGPLDELTPRERDVLALMAEGRSNAAIAQALVLELKTVEGHIRVIFSKLGLEPEPSDHRRVLAVLTWLREAT